MSPNYLVVFCIKSLMFDLKNYIQIPHKLSCVCVCLSFIHALPTRVERPRSTQTQGPRRSVARGKRSHMLSQSYIHPCRMHSPCRAVAEIQLPRTPSSQMSSCFLPTLSVAKGYRFHTEHLLASSLSCFESGPSRTHRESNLCKKAGSHCPL